MTVDTDQVVSRILDDAGSSPRFLMAIAGPPGAGKSTMAERLVEDLRSRGESAEILPMDGFHMDDGVLRQKGLLERKGAPATFDVRGFLDILKAVRQAEEEILVPVFDRTREIAIAAARAIPVSVRFVIVEGNYLLLDRSPWTPLAGKFDLTIMIAPPVATLEKRLMDRWLSLGFDETSARRKTEGNDLKNGELVLRHSRPADILLRC